MRDVENLLTIDAHHCPGEPLRADRVAIDDHTQPGCRFSEHDPTGCRKHGYHLVADAETVLFRQTHKANGAVQQRVTYQSQDYRK